MPDTSDNPVYTQLQKAIGDALDCLAAGQLTDEDVHAARKAITRARAMLRLLRPAVADPEYRLENIVLRDAGRCLSPLRDAKSLLDAFNAFSARHAARLHGSELGPIELSLLARHAQARRELVEEPSRLRLCVDSLASFRERMRQSNLAHAEPAIAIRGLHRMVRKGRKAFALARDARTSEALHEWRKQVKRLLHATVALCGPDARHPRKIVRRAGRIAKWLGDDHDLVMLQQAVADSAIDAGTTDIVCTLLARRRAKLQTRALDHGRMFFASKPKRFIARLARAARNHRGESSVPVPNDPPTRRSHAQQDLPG